MISVNWMNQGNESCIPVVYLIAVVYKQKGCGTATGG